MLWVDNSKSILTLPRMLCIGVAPTFSSSVAHSAFFLNMTVDKILGTCKHELPTVLQIKQMVVPNLLPQDIWCYTQFSPNLLVTQCYYEFRERNILFGVLCFYKHCQFSWFCNIEYPEHEFLCLYGNVVSVQLICNKLSPLLRSRSCANFSII